MLAVNTDSVEEPSGFQVSLPSFVRRTLLCRYFLFYIVPYLVSDVEQSRQHFVTVWHFNCYHSHDIKNRHY